MSSENALKNSIFNPEKLTYQQKDFSQKIKEEFLDVTIKTYNVQKTYDEYPKKNDFISIV